MKTKLFIFNYCHLDIPLVYHYIINVFSTLYHFVFCFVYTIFSTIISYFHKYIIEFQTMSILTTDAVVVDALPYIDHGYDEPGVREAALAMVDEETRRYRPTKNYLDHLPALNLASFETELMKTEFERLSNRQAMDTLSMKRYELPTPPPGKMSDVQAWSQCVDNTQAQLEHQRTRIMNLDLMLDYGGESWKVYNEVLQDMLTRYLMH